MIDVARHEIAAKDKSRIDKNSGRTLCCAVKKMMLMTQTVF